MKKRPPAIKRGRKPIYDFGAIKKDVPLEITDHNQNEILSMLRNYKKSHKGEFTTRRLNGTVQVWRTE
jgi:hypothetical protein